MAKRMKFSVVGLPHYTIWHLYEPSLDDIRHMEEMEKERLQREAEEKEKAERAQRIKDEFKDPSAQWEKDGAAIHDMMQKEQKEKAQKEQVKEQAKGAQKQGRQGAAPHDSKKGKD